MREDSYDCYAVDTKEPAKLQLVQSIRQNDLTASNFDKAELDWDCC